MYGKLRRKLLQITCQNTSSQYASRSVVLDGAKKPCSLPENEKSNIHIPEHVILIRAWFTRI